MDTLYSLGSAMGQEWETLGEVTDIAFGPQGRLFILDPQSHRVHVFDAEGRHLRSMGRQGQGPGEFQAPNGLEVGDDGTLYVQHRNAGGVHVFSAGGDFRRLIRVGSSAGSPVRGSLRVDVGGRLFWENGLHFMGGRQMSPGRSIVALDPDSGEAGLVFAQSDPDAMPGIGLTESGQVRIDMATVMSTEPPAFTPRFSWDVLGDGTVVVSDGISYEIGLWDEAGAERGRIQRDIPPRATRRADRAAEIERRRARLEAGGTGVSVGGEAAMLTAQEIVSHLRTLTFRDRIPVIAGLRASPGGLLWIERWRRPTDSPVAPIDLVRSDGRYLGTVFTNLPTRVGPEGLLAYEGVDEIGTPTVTVARIEWR